MENKKLFIIIRYIAILFLILGISIVDKDLVDVYSVVLILIFIINNQVRFFIIRNNALVVILSIIAEVVIAFFLYTNYGGVLFFYFLTAIFDGAFLLKGKKSYALNLIVIISAIAIGRGLNLSEIIATIAALITLGVLCSYIKEEYSEKLKAQDLYDKLRVSEDKLKKANGDLEAYANSVEELTLLRERNRLSREIHDSVGHSLSTMLIQLGAIEAVAKKDGGTAAEMANNLSNFARASLQEVRMAVRELKPIELQQYEGIIAVEELIKNFIKLTGIDVKLVFTKEKWQLNSDQSFVIYRVIQEFLSNSIRHGKATRVNIFMNFEKDNVIITLQDNGVGADEINKGMGLSSISERVKELGGRVSYNSKKNEGFLLKVILNRREKKIII